jgi:hypothetical protein
VGAEGVPEREQFLPFFAAAAEGTDRTVHNKLITIFNTRAVIVRGCVRVSGLLLVEVFLVGVEKS